MTAVHAFELGFAFGLFAWPVVYRTWVQFHVWRWERQFRAAERRFKVCAHERTTRVNVGSNVEHGTPHYADKCLDCWALKLKLNPNPDAPLTWHPNCAPPPRGP